MRSTRCRVVAICVLAIVAGLAALACAKPDARPVLKGLALRPYPSELEIGATPLPPDQVRELWVNYMSGVRLAPLSAEGERVPSTTDYCAGHTGQVVVHPEIAGATFRWDVVKEGNSLWNEALLVVNMDDPESPRKIGYRLDEPLQFKLNRADLAKTLVYDSPGCRK